MRAVTEAVQPRERQLSPGALRRRQLRQERRAERLRQVWRLVVFSSIATGLGYVLLRQGWNLLSPSQVEVVGSAVVGRSQVIEAAGLQFPTPLLGLSPRDLGAELSAALPVEKVRVSRLMLPPRLRVELTDREAVARAQRRLPSGLEMGYVDRLGSWISVHQSGGVRIKGSTQLIVKGWNERHRPALSLVLANRERIGPTLTEIRFAPDGSLWLVTTNLGNLRLGPVDGRLQERLEVAAHLVHTLPSSLPPSLLARDRGNPAQLIDLSDPDQPELSLSGPVKTGAMPQPGSAPVPRGAQ
jgi:cell division protein FtsQ